MSDTFYESMWCTACAAVTAHAYLHRDRYECTDGDCCRVRTWHLSDGLYGVGGTP